MNHDNLPAPDPCPPSAATLVQPPPLPSATGPNVWEKVIEETWGKVTDPDVSVRDRALWRDVVADMKARDAFGRAKYGVPLQPDNGRDHLRDSLDEALDLIAYLRSAMFVGDTEGSIEYLCHSAMTMCLRIRWLMNYRAELTNGDNPDDDPSVARRAGLASEGTPVGEEQP